LQGISRDNAFSKEENISKDNNVHKNKSPSCNIHKMDFRTDFYVRSPYEIKVFIYMGLARQSQKPINFRT